MSDDDRAQRQAAIRAKLAARRASRAVPPAAPSSDDAADAAKKERQRLVKEKLAARRAKAAQQESGAASESASAEDDKQAKAKAAADRIAAARERGKAKAAAKAKQENHSATAKASSSPPKPQTDTKKKLTIQERKEKILAEKRAKLALKKKAAEEQRTKQATKTTSKKKKQSSTTKTRHAAAASGDADRDTPPPPPLNDSDEDEDPPSVNQSKDDTSSTPPPPPPSIVGDDSATPPPPAVVGKFNATTSVTSSTDASLPPPPPHGAGLPMPPPPPANNIAKTPVGKKGKKKGRKGAAGGGDLLAAIRRGSTLRKTKTVDKSKPAVPGSRSKTSTPAGGMMAEMLAARSTLGKKKKKRLSRKGKSLPSTQNSTSCSPATVSAADKFGKKIARAKPGIKKKPRNSNASQSSQPSITSASTTQPEQSTTNNDATPATTKSSVQIEKKPSQQASAVSRAKIPENNDSASGHKAGGDSIVNEGVSKSDPNGSSKNSTAQKSSTPTPSKAALVVTQQSRAPSSAFINDDHGWKDSSPRSTVLRSARGLRRTDSGRYVQPTPTSRAKSMTTPQRSVKAVKPTANTSPDTDTDETSDAEWLGSQPVASSATPSSASTAAPSAAPKLAPKSPVPNKPREQPPWLATPAAGPQSGHSSPRHGTQRTQQAKSTGHLAQSTHGATSIKSLTANTEHIPSFQRKSVSPHRLTPRQRQRRQAEEEKRRRRNAEEQAVRRKAKADAVALQLLREERLAMALARRREEEEAAWQEEERRLEMSQQLAEERAQAAEDAIIGAAFAQRVAEERANLDDWCASDVDSLIANSRDPAEVVGAMRERLDDAKTQRQGCIAMANLVMAPSSVSASHRARFLRGGGVQALSESLRKYPGKVDVQECGLWAAAALAHNSVPGTTKLHLGGFLNIAMAALQRAPRGYGGEARLVGVQAAACAVLRRLAGGGVVQQVHILRADAVPALLGILRRGVHELSGESTAHLATSTANLDTHVLNVLDPPRGPPARSPDEERQRVTHIRLIEEAVLVLESLAQNGDGQAAIVMESGVDLLFDVLRWALSPLSAVRELIPPLPFESVSTSATVVCEGPNSVLQTSLCRLFEKLCENFTAKSQIQRHRSVIDELRQTVEESTAISSLVGETAQYQTREVTQAAQAALKWATRLLRRLDKVV